MADEQGDLEQIKQLKARYCRLLDQKRWDEWQDVFTTDVRLRYGPSEAFAVEGSRQLAELASRRFESATTVHCAYMPEIQLTSADTAEATWAMFDYVEFWHLRGDQEGSPDPDVFLGYRKGWGHYVERYRKAPDGHWRIAEVRLRRIRVDRVPGGRDRAAFDQRDFGAAAAPSS